jgi:hypothetical protein
MYFNIILFSKIVLIKGTVSRVYLQVSFMNHLPQAPDFNIRVSFNFFKTLGGIRKSRCIKGINSTGGYTYFRRFDTSINDTGRKFATDVSYCLHLNANLKKNCIYL